ncbi:MAG: hypothetical protein GY943_14415 [Chloroflexi bacterium]|nr:hypothetical protein [Chloroflexota bacterium]
MSTELEFIQTRQRIVQDGMDDPNPKIEPHKRLSLQREHRLLTRVLAELPEGEVLSTLLAWRGYLGEELVDHTYRHRAQQRAFDRWLRLSRNQRENTPRPEPPPLGAKVPDHKGNMWIVDERFLAMMDDLLKRFKRWLDSE